MRYATLRCGLTPAALALTAFVLVGTPAAALAQGMEGEAMAHEEHQMMAAEVEAAIEAAAADMAEAMNAGDAEAVAALYTEDGVMMPPGGEAVTGRAAVEAAISEHFEAMPGMRLTFETREVKAVHDYAIEIGGYVAEDADGAHLDHGKYLTVWTRTDDGWKVARDIWNSDMGGGM